MSIRLRQTEINQDPILEVIDDEANLVIPAISILATGQTHQASLYTMDNDFQYLNDLKLLTPS